MQTKPWYLINTKTIVVTKLTSLNNELYSQVKQSHAYSLRNCCKHQNYLEPVNSLIEKCYAKTTSWYENKTVRSDTWLKSTLHNQVIIIYNVSSVILYYHYSLWNDIASKRRTVTETCLCLLVTVIITVHFIWGTASWYQSSTFLFHFAVLYVIQCKCKMSKYNLCCRGLLYESCFLCSEFRVRISWMSCRSYYVCRKTVLFDSILHITAVREKRS